MQRTLLTKYKKIENIYAPDSEGKALLYLSEYTAKRDLKSAICFAYKAAKTNVERGGLLFLKLTLKIKNKDNFNFLKKIKIDTNYCDNYINKKYILQESK